MKYYPTQPRLAFANLQAYCLGLNLSEIAVATGTSRHTLHRWMHDGVPIYSADTVAIRLGVHPIDIWPTFHLEESPCPA